ncbi:helix-turn-helix domain-containing protein [Streptomyces sp. NPDC005485]|uniref:helix-turn-helix domain-containing protein n=1 Tax=Streptomyces sp. NPDC005485 TaxID=3155591 RepID=UPI0033ACE0BB
MVRVHFTAEDLLGVAFATEPAPLMELGMAVAMLQRREAPVVLTAGSAGRQSFPVGARPMLGLIPPAGSDVARELDVSKSSASEHTKALRDARLITTHRDGKAVWHTCTPLGLDLLTTRSEPAHDGRRAS